MRALFFGLIAFTTSVFIAHEPVFAGYASVQEGEPVKLALVIGNDAYAQPYRLQEARADAKKVGAALSSAGFDVETAFDLAGEEIVIAIRRFIGRARDAGPGSDVIVYYSGFASSDGEATFPVGVDIDLESDFERGLSASGISIEWLIRYLDVDGTAAVFVDAPVDRLLSQNKPTGLQRTASRIVEDLFSENRRGDIVYMTAGQAGELVLDGGFADALARYIRENGVGDYADLTQRVTAWVRRSSEQRQWPDYATTLAPTTSPPGYAAYPPEQSTAEPPEQRTASTNATSSTAAPVSPAPAPTATSGFTPAPSPAEPDRPAAPRVALVIGASEYEMTGWALENPARDALLMNARLNELGFEVISPDGADKEALDDALKELRRTIRDLGERTDQEVTALFYFAGHAIQFEGLNFLVPTDAEGTTDFDIMADSVRLGDVLNAIRHGGAKHGLVFLDACRNNPLPAAQRSAGGDGLVDEPTRPADSVLIGYATRPGLTAADGEGANSPYTEVLAELMYRDEPVETLLRKVNTCVAQRTGGGQQPTFEGGLIGFDSVVMNAAGVEGPDTDLEAFCTP